MILTDTHCHIYLEQFDEDRDDVMKRAFGEGVKRVFLPNIDTSSIASLKKLTKDYPENCFPMMGLHPCSVGENFEEELSTLKAELDQGGYYAIGEIGIDLYWDKTFFEHQVKAFEKQIEWAKELNLPIVIHARDSFQEIFEVLDRLNDEKLKGIFHCFTGGKDEAEKILSYGNFMLGLGGVLTFKNSGVDKAVADVPMNKIILETDAPYLAPTPYRGKRNEPAYVKEVALKLADIKGLSLNEIAEITTSNSKLMFGV